MQFEGRLGGAPADILIDSAASHTFICLAYAQQIDIAIVPGIASVELANGSDQAVSGICMLRLQLGDYTADIFYHVVKLAVHWSLVLGESWIVPHKGRREKDLQPKVSISCYGP